jgi:hypothetical protein
MKKSRNLGMQTFDQALFDLYEANVISYEDALRNADSLNDLRLQIKLNSQRAKSPDLARAPSISRSSEPLRCGATRPTPAPALEARRLAGGFFLTSRAIHHASTNPRNYDEPLRRKVAFLGLGVMGYPMAGHLALAGP